MSTLSFLHGRKINVTLFLVLRLDEEIFNINQLQLTMIKLL